MPASAGVRGVLKRTSPKKATPVISNTVGVMAAATPHPYFLKMKRLSNIIINVATPVYVEKSPMNEEYSLGLGNCTNTETKLHCVSPCMSRF